MHLYEMTLRGCSQLRHGHEQSARQYIFCRMPPRSICANPFSLAYNSTSDSKPDSTMSGDKDNNKSNKPFDFSDVPREREEPRPDFSKPLPRKRLPAALQDTLDNEEKLWEAMYEGHAAESTDSSLRYAGYASRVRTILLSAHRYVAYTSDIGESFRPIAHPYLVKGAYGVSWAYLVGDVAHEGYKAYLRNERVLHPETPADGQNVVSSDKHADAQPNKMQLGPGVTGGSVGQASAARVPAIEDYRTVMVQRAIFQGIASMGLPAFTIHSIVKYTGKALKNNKNVALRTWGPIGVSILPRPGS